MEKSGDITKKNCRDTPIRKKKTHSFRQSQKFLPAKSQNLARGKKKGWGLERQRAPEQQQEAGIQVILPGVAAATALVQEGWGMFRAYEGTNLGMRWIRLGPKWLKATVTLMLTSLVSLGWAPKSITLSWLVK
jgi:hypothetical protein